MRVVGALLVFVIAVAFVCGDDSTTNADGPPVTNAPAPETTSTEAPPPTKAPSTKAPSTKAPPPTQAPTEPPKVDTTQAPIPTTAPAAVTTQEPPVTEVPTTTPKVTVAPTTTSAPVTTPAPTSAPLPADPATGTYTTECIRLEMAARFNVSYTSTKTNETSFYLTDLPTNTSDASSLVKVSGECGDANHTAQNILIEFMPGTDAVFTWSVNFAFQQEETKQSVKDITFSYDTSAIADAKPQTLTLLHNETYGDVTGDNSYLCKAKESISFLGDSATTVTVSNVQLQAYSKDTKGFQGKAVECSADAYTSNIVPIAVGAALAALVVIVLIAYLVSRSRNQSGYESV